MSIRMQVTIPEEDHARASEKAAASGVSLAEYLRRLVRRDVGGEPTSPLPDIDELFGIGASRGGDVARHKQEYLGKAVAAGKAGKPMGS